MATMLEHDAELRRHRRVLRRALDVRRTDRVLDIGCGTGQTTRDVGRLARGGCVIGIDCAERALDLARRRTRAAGLRHVHYVCGDAARPPLSRGSFDVAVSRFGTMFFADPDVAFARLRAVLRPAARLVMMVWQPAHRNEWAVVIHRALTGHADATPPPHSGPSAFSLGEKHTVERLLTAAGFVDVAFQPVYEPVYYGADAERALGFVSCFVDVQRALASTASVERERVRDRLLDALRAHDTHDGVWLGACAWVVRARCR